MHVICGSINVKEPSGTEEAALHEIMPAIK
jgi:hypothetical protein